MSGEIVSLVLQGEMGEKVERPGDVKHGDQVFCKIAIWPGGKVGRMVVAGDREGVFVEGPALQLEVVFVPSPASSPTTSSPPSAVDGRRSGGSGGGQMLSSHVLSRPR